MPLDKNTTTFTGPTDLRFHDKNRSGFQEYFLKELLKEPGITGRVLDVGCGPNLPTALEGLRSKLTNLDGLDPNADEVLAHPLLKLRWASCLEEAPVEPSAYDLAYSYNVAEHISTPKLFLEKVGKCLKPGGAYWSLSNHALHPFARIVRLIEALKLKRCYARKAIAKTNDYPAYYRLNSVGQYYRHLSEETFSRIDFHFYPCMQWDCYFPKSLRAIPHLYDRILGTRFSAAMMILMVRVEKRGLTD